jgi:WS/DGAT/MGAT family acyltransferase
MQRMSSQDAAFLYGETDAWHMHVASLVIVDPAESGGRFSFERVRDLTVERLPQVPQFRWVLVEVPFGVDLPGWIEGPPIDADYHIKSVSLPAPGDENALSDFVGELVARKLDRRRPLWEIYVISGLWGGRAAVLTKVHHALIDGVSGAGLSEVLMDITQEPREAPSEGRHLLDAARPSEVELFRWGVVNTAVQTPLRLVRFGLQSLRQALTASRTYLSSSHPAIPYTAPKTHLTGEFTSRRKLGSAALDIDRLKVVRKAFGITMNDLVLTLCAGSLRNYLLEHDDLPDHALVVQCPVSLRKADDRDSVGSKVGSMFVELATNIEDPIERLRAVSLSATRGKQMHRLLGEHNHMGITETAPPGLIGLAARLYTSMHLDRAPAAVNFVVSNVPGPPLQLYVAGAPVERMLPIGPLLLGMGLNITAFSHNHQLDVSVCSCPDLVADPQRIADGMESSLIELERSLVNA